MSLSGRYDGGGSLLKYPFLQAVLDLEREFDTCFEWCAGMGEIGELILTSGLCSNLVLADINPNAITIARKICPKAKCYVSDNMKNIPEQKFDLIVANPPNYFNIQKDHVIGKMLADDLRPNDRGWAIHKEFYSTIGPYLATDAVMLISEVEPYLSKVYLGAQPYDVRNEAPIVTFSRMIRHNDLTLYSCEPFHEVSGLMCYLLTILGPGCRY